MKASTSVRTQRASRSVERGDEGLADRLKRPPVQPGAGDRHRLAQVSCACRDPRPYRLHLGRREPALGRHLASLNLLDQQTLLDVPRHDGRTGLSAPERRRPAAEIEPALLLVGIVTTDAALRQDLPGLLRQLRLGRLRGSRSAPPSARPPRGASRAPPSPARSPFSCSRLLPNHRHSANIG